MGRYSENSKRLEMTLIASTFNYNQPFLIGDLLISSETAIKSIQLPTNTSDVTKYLNSNSYLPDKLNLKVYIINNHVAIALAGDVREITEFLKELKIRCSYYDEAIDEEVIMKFLYDYEYSTMFAQSAFCIYLGKPNGNKISFQHICYPDELWRTKTTEVFGKVFASGTGANEFLHQATIEQVTRASTEKGSFLRTKSVHLSFFARMLAVERFALVTVKKNWGGGFEMIYFDGKSFNKIDDFAYVINYGQFDESGDFDLPVPELIQYYKYVDSILVITSIEVEKWERIENENEIILTSSHFKEIDFRITCLDKPEITSIKSPRNLSFATNSLAFGYAIKTLDNGMFTPSFFVEKPTMGIIYDSKKLLKLVIDKREWETIHEYAMNLFPSL
jgi:hypothetical protein